MELGQIGDQKIYQFVLGDPNSLHLMVTNYGARIQKLSFPDLKGGTDNLICGFDNLSSYQLDGSFHGAIVGPYANRISGGKFSLDGNQYQLTQNEGNNTLHGAGLFDRKVWECREAGPTHVVFECFTPDGEAGFPGNLKVRITYSVLDLCELQILIHASSDKATPVSISNHAYFNLEGVGKSDILNHLLWIDSNSITEVDEELIPTGRLVAVENGPFDFTTPKQIGLDIKKVVGGYDHNYVLNPSSGPVARLSDPATQRTMTVSTSQPGLQVYSGNFLDGSAVGLGGAYEKYGAICLETQSFPDAPNKDVFPNSILRPGDIYEHWTRYRFSQTYEDSF